MAFDGFLSLIPLFALAGWIVHNLGYDNFLLRVLLAVSPVDAGEVADADPLRMSQNAVITLAPVSAVIFVWLSSSGIATAMGVCEVMFEANVRPWWRRRLIALGWVVGALLTVTAGSALAYALVAAMGPRLGRLVAMLVMSPLVLAFLIAFFRTAIRRPRGMRRHVWQGAVVTMALWGIVSFLFSTYVHRVASYSLLYGSLATIAMVMVWLWLLSCSLLIGGELNAQLEGVREFPPSTAFDPSGKIPLP